MAGFDEASKNGEVIAQEANDRMLQRGCHPVCMRD